MSPVHAHLVECWLEMSHNIMILSFLVAKAKRETWLVTWLTETKKFIKKRKKKASQEKCDYFQ